MRRIFIFRITLFTIAIAVFGGYARGTNVCGGYYRPADSLAAKLGVAQELLREETVLYSLEEGGENLVARAWLCDNAKETLDIQYYIFARDNTGKIACDFILRAAHRGVNVRILIDDATVRLNTKEMSLLDSHDRIEIRVYNPGIKLGRPRHRIRIVTRPREIHRRMHNKSIIIDGQVAITGGRNIADQYFDYSDEYNYRDRDLLLIGKEVTPMIAAFETFWNDSLSRPYEELVNTGKKKYHKVERFDEIHAYACDTDNFSNTVRQTIAGFPGTFREKMRKGEIRYVRNVVFVTDEPGKNRNRPGRKGGVTTDSIIALIASARETIDIQSPYLILNDSMASLFTAAVRRGVKVRVLTNSLAATDNLEAFGAYRRERKRILEMGIGIHEFKPHPLVAQKVMSRHMEKLHKYKARLGLHSKTLIVDGKISVIGSYNLDPRSADLNTECFVIIRDPLFTKTVDRYVQEEFLPGNAWRTTEEFNPDHEAGVLKRLKLLPRQIIPKHIL